MALLSFEDIQKTSDVSEEDIHIPEWGGEVRVRSLTRRQIKDITKASSKRVGKRIEIQSDIFEKGVFFYGLVHPQITEDQYESLIEKNTGPLQKIMDAIMRLSKLSDDDEDAEESLKAEEGTFPERSRSVLGVSSRGEAGEDTRGTSNRGAAATK